MTDESKVQHAIAYCCWRGCQRTVSAFRMPEDWRHLYLFWAAAPINYMSEIATMDRESVLCPEHVAALNALLQDRQPVTFPSIEED
jgi:hypothetical protein